jgi:hypothetical protein
MSSYNLIKAQLTVYRDTRLWAMDLAERALIVGDKPLAREFIASARHYSRALVRAKQSMRQFPGGAI